MVIGWPPQTWSRPSADLVALCPPISADLVAPLRRLGRAFTADLVALLRRLGRASYNKDTEHLSEQCRTPSERLFKTHSRITEKRLLSFFERKRGQKRRTPPPEGGGVLTLYGHRLPSLYRDAIESQHRSSAKHRKQGAPQWAAGRPQKRFAGQDGSGDGPATKPLLTLLEISSGVWGLSAPTILSSKIIFKLEACLVFIIFRSFR